MFQNLLLVTIIACECLSEETPSVVSKSGKIVGLFLTSFSGNKYEAYLGIPYALPPIGERRFEPPVPMQPWPNDLVAKRLRSTCWQLERAPFPSETLVHGDEDCLYLNVFVSYRNANKSLPVLFWIHGGGFQFGSHKPEEEVFLMDHEIVLVTVQYRLGTLGFLSTEDEVVPGNMGLKDQSLALKWVYENIEFFGGDSKKITLYGLSAGGASVHYHYLSPMSAGLFQNGVSFSGTAYDSWAQTDKSREKTLELGRLVNCTTRNIGEMIQCLRERPARLIVKTQLKFMPWKQNPSVPFGPVVDKFSERPFINRTPREIIESGKVYDVPWITGVVSEEGLYPVAEWTSENALKEINDNWDRIAPLLLDYNDTITVQNHSRLAQAIKKYYFNKELITRETFMTLVYLVGDRWFVVDAENAARAQSKINKSPVWFYRYTYRASDSMSIKLSNSSENFGVCHGDNLYLFMKNSIISPTKSSNDMLMLRYFIRALTSFASEGNFDLGTTWLKIDPEKSLRYLEIQGPGNATIKTAENLGQRKFWNSLDFNENKVSRAN